MCWAGGKRVQLADLGEMSVCSHGAGSAASSFAWSFSLWPANVMLVAVSTWPLRSGSGARVDRACTPRGTRPGEEEKRGSGEEGERISSLQAASPAPQAGNSSLS